MPAAAMPALARHSPFAYRGGQRGVQFSPLTTARGSLRPVGFQVA